MKSFQSEVIAKVNKSNNDRGWPQRVMLFPLLYTPIKWSLKMVQIVVNGELIIFKPIALKNSFGKSVGKSHNRMF